MRPAAMAAAAAGGAGGGIGSSSTGGYGLAGGPSLGAVLGGTRGGPMLDGKGMTFLERTHPVLESILTRRFDDSAKVDDVDSKIVDFDGAWEGRGAHGGTARADERRSNAPALARARCAEVTYRVIARADEKDVTYVCGSFPFFAHLRGCVLGRAVAVVEVVVVVVVDVRARTLEIQEPSSRTRARKRGVRGVNPAFTAALIS